MKSGVCQFKWPDVVTMPLLWCYDFDSMRYIYNVTGLEFVLWRHAMYECVIRRKHWIPSHINDSKPISTWRLSRKSIWLTESQIGHMLIFHNGSWWLIMAYRLLVYNLHQYWLLWAIPLVTYFNENLFETQPFWYTKNIWNCALQTI